MKYFIRFETLLLLLFGILSQCLLMSENVFVYDNYRLNRRNMNNNNHPYSKTKPTPVPLWKQRACEKVQRRQSNMNYLCDDVGNVKCLPGWQGDLCQVPICRRGCDPMNGYCQRPGECRCRLGYTGELCDRCIPLPGCKHGDCRQPFECHCRPGWDGLFCTEPTCRRGCHNTRGYCESPGECRCRLGWAGRNCSECAVLPGCQYGTCSKPLECHCMTGYTGLLCTTPICAANCSKQHGYCQKPGECRCKIGWTGENCDQCFPYPGCVHGNCHKPWECNCKPGWGGIRCDEALTYCSENLNICGQGGTCVSLTKSDGNYRCHCKQGYFGINCESIDEFLATSTTAPKITPPPPPDSTNFLNKVNYSSMVANNNSMFHLETHSINITHTNDKIDNNDKDINEKDEEKEEEEQQQEEEKENIKMKEENIERPNQITTEKTIVITNRTENHKKTEHNIFNLSTTQKIFKKGLENTAVTTITDKIIITKNQLNKTDLSKKSHPNSILSEISSTTGTVTTPMIIKNKKILKEIAPTLSKYSKTSIISKDNSLESIRIHKHQEEDDCDDWDEDDDDDDDDDDDGFGLSHVLGGKLRFDNILNVLDRI